MMKYCYDRRGERVKAGNYVMSYDMFSEFHRVYKVQGISNIKSSGYRSETSDGKVVMIRIKSESGKSFKYLNPMDCEYVSSEYALKFKMGQRWNYNGGWYNSLLINCV